MTSYVQGKIADDIGALIMMDIARIIGVVVGPDPFKFCDIVTTTAPKKVCFEIFLLLYIFALKLKERRICICKNIILFTCEVSTFLQCFLQFLGDSKSELLFFKKDSVHGDPKSDINNGA